ncbi:hypothetical protein J6590_100640 [Homalodisca vitripennis]|nr:hypothetical protein J6590_100640 [Homalodisca vitripennis]
MLTPNSYNHPAVTSSCLRQTTSTNNGYVKNKLTTSTILLSPHLVSDTSLPQATVMLTLNEHKRPALTSSRLRHISSTGNHTYLAQPTVMSTSNNYYCPTDISSCLRHVSSTANRELNTKQLQLPRSHLTSSEKHLF